jgi:hypothetical protein
MMPLLRTFVRFWWDFVVGDEWRIAVVVAVAAVLGGLAAADGGIRGQLIACGIAGGVMLAVCVVVIAGGRGRSRV